MNDHYPVYTDSEDVAVACSFCSSWRPAIKLISINDCVTAKQRFQELDGWIHGQAPRPSWLDELEHRVLAGSDDPPWWVTRAAEPTTP